MTRPQAGSQLLEVKRPSLETGDGPLTVGIAWWWDLTV